MDLSKLFNLQDIFRILRELGVTAVLNAAQGNLEGWSMVNTKESFYSPHNIQFLGVQAVDLKSFPLAEYFQQAADWIEQILADKGTVFVHCVQVCQREGVKKYFVRNLIFHNTLIFLSYISIITKPTNMIGAVIKFKFEEHLVSGGLRRDNNSPCDQYFFSDGFPTN